MDLLDEDERAELLNHPVPRVRAAAANSFFNRELTAEQRKKLLASGQGTMRPLKCGRAPGKR